MKIDIPFLPEKTLVEIPPAAVWERPQCRDGRGAEAPPTLPDTPRLPLARAEKIAEAVAAKLRAAIPGLQLEIAGSIRRRRPTVGDIDLVILGHRDDVVAIVRRGCRIVTAGAQNVIAEFQCGSGLSAATVQLDLFFARPSGGDLFKSTPTNFGTLLLCRTGSVSHNIYLVEHAKTLNRRWQPYEGVLDAAGNLLACETEADIFTALKLPWIKPEDRER